MKVKPLPVATAAPEGSGSISHSRDATLLFCAVDWSVKMTVVPWGMLVCAGAAVNAAVTVTPPPAAVTV